MLASGARDSGSSPLGGAGFLCALAATLLVLAACDARLAPPAQTPTLKTAVIRIPAYRFEPERLEVGRGTVVSWENDDSERHVIANSPTAAIPFNPDGTYDLRGSRFLFTLDPGGTASFTFNDAGTYYYYSLDQNTMKGVIVVR